MMLAAQEHYVSLLKTPAGDPARTYLRERGFTDESIQAFGFGLTPVEGSGLTRHLRAKGYAVQDQVACSLARISERDGRPYDFLRQKITFPIHDGQGRIIGFGGRSLDGREPKYINSGGSRLFDKSRNLYGFHKARGFMRARGRAVVVECYLDVLMLRQAGIPEAVACLGTALTEPQLRLLRHATGQAVLLFDGDSAGQRATLAAVTTALSVPDLSVRAAVLPSGEDPDSFVRKEGAEALERMLATSQDLLDFAVRAKIKATPPLGIPELVRKELVPWLARVEDQVQRGFLMSRVAQLTGVPTADLSLALHGSNASAAQQAAARAAASAGASAAEAPKPLAPL